MLIVVLFTPGAYLRAQTHSTGAYNDEHRPQIHFTPKANWMNDPNGMVFYKGVYHLFFQYYPDSTVWGPNHWGHATSTDLVHWKEWAPGLSPDTLGLIASGSAVVDAQNTSGFGSDGKPPLVAIFTHINYKAPKEKLDSSQYQSIAYSLDEGKSWTKYANNPVIKSFGVRDFRDPKVIWFEQEQKWVMTVATKDRVTFYSSKDLKNWTKESEFGKEAGAHGGVWECPDLFLLKYNGEDKWVLMCSINPGGPYGGSATQYFIGRFNGKNFTPDHTDTKWVDYGTDNYAGVTWANTGNRKIFLGWMSNWQYANVVPMKAWRSAMTVPRELKLVKVNNEYLLNSTPVKELNQISSKAITFNNVNVSPSINLSQKIKKLSGQYQITITADQLKNFSVILSNSLKEEVTIGFSKEENAYYIDRTKSGKADFKNGFARRMTGPRLAKNNTMNLTIIVDAASVELFADDGLTVMTGIFFPNETYNQARIMSDDSFLIKKLSYTEMKSIWIN